ncbi:MAG: hypothetical protein ABJO09_06550 [Hyphomicrobiales bacterium]|uniref:hypothetical protein n=4 Tax=Pseudomonadota TaxID=1224 RepID=UPI00326312F5
MTVVPKMAPGAPDLPRQQKKVFKRFEPLNFAGYSVSPSQDFRNAFAENRPNAQEEIYACLLERRVAKINRIVERKNKQIYSYEVRLKQIFQKTRDRREINGTDHAERLEQLRESFQDYYELTESNICDWHSVISNGTFYRHRFGPVTVNKIKLKQFERIFNKLEIEMEQQCGPQSSTVHIEKLGRHDAVEQSNNKYLIETELKSFLTDNKNIIDIYENFRREHPVKDARAFKFQRYSRLTNHRKFYKVTKGTKFLTQSGKKPQALLVTELDSLVERSFFLINSQIIKSINASFAENKNGDDSIEWLESIQLALEEGIRRELGNKLWREVDFSFEDFIVGMSERCINFVKSLDKIVADIAEPIFANPHADCYYKIDETCLFLALTLIAQDTFTIGNDPDEETVAMVRRACITWLKKWGKDEEAADWLFKDDTFLIAQPRFYNEADAIDGNSDYCSDGSDDFFDDSDEDA